MLRLLLFPLAPPHLLLLPKPPLQQLQQQLLVHHLAVPQRQEVLPVT